MAEVVTRFAPSPTGHLNIGGVRTGIFAYLFARHNKGKFVLRIEDTDRERSKKEYEESIIESMHWLGLGYDVMYRQSDNIARYEELLHTLVDKNLAYISKEEPKEEGGRTEVIRFRNPKKAVTFDDAVRGAISFDTTELGDFVIAKSFTEPLFHFAVVVDDWDEGVTHVVRGEDHISNTPRHMLIQDALGAPRPVYAHLPLIVGGDKSKLSKRKGAKPIIEYRELGYLPEAILNFDAFLGWHPTGEKEVYSKKELIEEFTLDRVQKNAAMFDDTKLLWFNREHIKNLSDFAFAERLEEYMKMMGEELPSYTATAVPMLKERSETLLQAMDALKTGEFEFLKSDLEAPSGELLLQGAKAGKELVIAHFKKLEELLGALGDEAFTPEAVKNAVFPYASEVGRGAVLWPMRVALSGKEKSPDPFTLAGVLGKQTTLTRIAAAKQAL